MTEKHGGRLAHASLWSVAGRIGAKLLDLPALIILSHLLSQADFGLVAKAMSIIVILEAVTLIPTSLPILRVANPTAAMFNTAFTLAALRGLILFSIIAALAWPLSIYFREPRFPELVMILSLAPISRGMFSPRMTDFMREYNLRPEAAADFLSKVSSFVVVVTTAYLTGSYWALAAGTITTTFVRSAYTFKVAPFRPAFSLSYWREFADILGWNTVVQILATTLWQLDALLLGRTLPTTVFGQYAVSRTLSEQPHQAIAVSLTWPMAISFLTANDNTRRAELWLNFSNTVVYFIGPIWVTMAVLSNVAVNVILGPQWQHAGIFLLGLSLSSLAALPGLPLNDLCISLQKSKNMAGKVLLQVLAMIPMMLAGFALGGVIGVIIAKGLLEAMMALVTMLYVRSLLGLPLRRQITAMLRSVAGLIALAATLYLIQPWIMGPLDTTSRFVMGLQALMVFGVGILVYFATTSALWWLQGRPNTIEALILLKIRGIMEVRG